MRTGYHGAAAIVALALGGAALLLPGSSRTQASAPAPLETQVVAMRRLTEAQYRNSIADIFGPEIRVAGRFEPIVRPAHELIASGARESSVSPAGLEQFDAMARNIAAQVFDGTHRSQFVTCAPADPKAADPACAQQVLAPIGRYLFRRPLSIGEQDFYGKLASTAAGQTGSFDKGLELALATMLVSPHFLYVVERAGPDPERPGYYRLDDYSRAARLSFMLWNSTPNATLLKAAEGGRLQDPKLMQSVAASMVHSPRFEQGVRAFFSDMLLFEKFDELAKDPVVYPYFNPDVAKALPEQTLRTITGHLLERDGDYRTLFTTSLTSMNRALGALYQVPVRKSSGWESYDFGPQSDRGGLLGQAGFLALYSHSGRSSPTLRGRAVREVLMCQPVPNPPGNVNFTAVQDVHNKAMPTARIRLTQHNTDPVCAACHKITDPIGLTLEHFDGIGAFRPAENGSPIDVAGELDGMKFTGASGLGKALALSPDTTMCLTARVIEYALGKPTEDADLVDGVEKRFAAGNYGIRDLFQAVAAAPETYEVKLEPLPGAPRHTGLTPVPVTAMAGNSKEMKNGL